MRQYVMFLLILFSLLILTGKNYAAESVADVARKWRYSETDSSIRKALSESSVFFKSMGAKDKRFAEAYDVASRYSVVLMARPCSISAHWEVKKEYSWDWPTSKDDEALAVTVDRFQQALARYPEDYVSSVGLKAVIFVNNLLWRGNKVGGGYDRRDGVVFIPIYLHVVPEFVEYAFHHEFFHLMQMRFYRTEILSWEKWRPLLAPGTVYASTGITDFLSGKTSAIVEHPSLGFVTGYAAADYMHDQTELFCYMIIPERSARLAEWTRTDVSLRKKEAFLRSAIDKISPGFNDVFDTIRAEGMLYSGMNKITWNVHSGKLHITVDKIHITGYSGKGMRAWVQLYENTPSEKSPVYYKHFTPESDNHVSSPMTFVFPFSGLRSHFKTGDKKLKMRFGVTGDQNKVVSNTFREIEIRLDIN